MKRFNHAYDIAFSLESFTENATDVTPQDIRQALQKRIASMCDNELMQATGAPFNTYEIVKDTPYANLQDAGLRGAGLSDASHKGCSASD
jgi:hypothetical protein